jgi:chaperonin cofactor prefoldin
MHARQASLIQQSREVLARVVPHPEQLQANVPKYLAQLAKIEHALKEAGKLLQDAHIELSALESDSPIALDPKVGPAFKAAEAKLTKAWEGWIFPGDIEHLRTLLKDKAVK